MIDKLKFKKEGLWFGDFLLYLSQDEMLVYLPVKPSERVLLKDFIKNWETIKEELKKANIFGVLEEPELVDDKLIVAKGIPPTPPIPEKLEFLEKFALLLSDAKAEKLELDTQDLREAPKRLICVEPNEIIAKWIPPIPGIPGMNVLGEPIPSPEVKESAKIILGENLFIDEEGWVKAKTSGVVGLQGNKLEILSEYTIDGDVDFSVGNIRFIGKKLTIKGDIKFGFKVRVKGDLELYGGTENKVLIEIEGNFLCDGIIRGEETKVKVKGRAEV
ncbi:FapA family protein, partial [Thermodesulfobacterium commune]